MKTTKKQRKIWDMYINKKMSVKEISSVNNTSTNAVYQIVRKLKKAKFFPVLKKKSEEKSGYTMEPHILRLHGIEFNIKIKPTQTYQSYPDSYIFFESTKIKLMKKSIEIYLKKSFYAETSEELHRQLIDFINPYFYRLGEFLGIEILRKGRTENVKIVNWHWAECNNEIAKDYRKKAEKLRVYTQEGKLWCLADYSLNIDELETLNEKARENFNRVEDMLNFVREKHNMTLSDMQEALLVMKERYTEIIESFNIFKKPIEEKKEDSKPEDKTPPDYIM